MDANDVQSVQLLQLKLYLKILGILYFREDMNTPINASYIKNVIKMAHIFDNIQIASKPRVVQVLSGSDMVIVQIDIWDAQSGNSAKTFINCSFNVGSFITIIRGANINPRVLQCKNCQKWDHTTFVCKFQRSRYIKYNSSHKSEYHHHFTQCYKANFKINLPRLETKQGESCPHLFKCLNCKGDHQTDSNMCPFWKHQFNKEWHMKKY